MIKTHYEDSYAAIQEWFYASGVAYKIQSPVSKRRSRTCYQEWQWCQHTVSTPYWSEAARPTSRRLPFWSTWKQTNKQTNGWVNRNIPARTIACSWRRSLDKRRLQRAAARLVQASVSMIFLFPVHSNQCMSNIHRYPQSPKMDQQYKMLLMLPITPKLGRMNSYSTQWHKCVDLYLVGYEWQGLLIVLYTWWWQKHGVMR